MGLVDVFASEKRMVFSFVRQIISGYKSKSQFLSWSLDAVICNRADLNQFIDCNAVSDCFDFYIKLGDSYILRDDR